MWAPDTPSGDSPLCRPQDHGGQAQVHGHPTTQSLTRLGNHFSIVWMSGPDFGLGGCLSACRLGDLLVADKYQPPYQVGPHCDLSGPAFLLLSRSVGGGFSKLQVWFFLADSSAFTPWALSVRGKQGTCTLLGDPQPDTRVTVHERFLQPRTQCSQALC